MGYQAQKFDDESGELTSAENDDFDDSDYDADADDFEDDGDDF